MSIESLFYGQFAIASEYELNVMRHIFRKMIAETEGHPAFHSLVDSFEKQIDNIDFHIENLRRESRIAEQNAKHREDRPNA